MAYVGPPTRQVLTGGYCSTHWEAVGYPLLSSSLVYDVLDIFVEARLTQVFLASTNCDRQVAYLFEVPPEAAVRAFTATVGTTKITAIVEEKSKAEQIYQAAVAAKQPAWKLDQRNSEIFQISLGEVKPDEKITIEITYTHLLSSDTLEDSIRLTIPAGLAARAGSAPASQTTPPIAIAGSDAVSIKVGIRSGSKNHIFGLNCLSHHALIVQGFHNAAYRKLTSAERSAASDPSSAYIEFTSKTFLTTHFVLTWNVLNFDQPRCVVEARHALPAAPTLAFGLSFVSNITLDVTESHEYIFLIDSSKSMEGALWQTTRQAVESMLDWMPTKGAIFFNVYFFSDGGASSVFPSGASSVYDTTNAAAAKTAVSLKSPAGVTNINGGLAAVVNQRTPGMERTSVIVITGGLDWGVAEGMNTVSTAVKAAADESRLLRVFVLGLGDNVSRGMCEGLARAGMGATAYIGGSDLAENDNTTAKAQTLMGSIGLAPVRVRSIDWGVTPAAPSAPTAPSSDFEAGRPPLDTSKFGAVEKGDNLPPPPAMQQAPKPGTMFWALRSNWFAIIQGKPTALFVTVKYDVAGSHPEHRSTQIPITAFSSGGMLHALAAHSIIQTLEDKELSLANDSAATYWNEAEIIRLGKTYTLASTQTSFVATMNGVGTQTSTVEAEHVPTVKPLDASLVFLKASGSPPATASSYAAMDETSDFDSPAEPLSFSASFAEPPSSSSFSSFARNSSPPSMGSLPKASASRSFVPQDTSDDDEEANDQLSQVVAAQNANGSFTPNAIAQIIFPMTGTPTVPAFIAVLSGREEVKELIWCALCAAAFLTQKFSDRQDEWLQVKSQAVEFARTQLDCIFGLGVNRIEDIIAKSMDDAEGYFF
ncbi:vault protein inter-alpha-trypsin domain-containing protein [Mycena crocata]|nr:vault protein inter-alpha-trypsin domain-containing protein [Mycena crocata]